MASTTTGGDYTNNFGPGITWGVCKNINVQGANVFNNSQSGSGAFPGISVAANTSNFMVSNCQLGVGGRIALAGGANNQSYGIVVGSGSSDYYNIIANRGANVTGIVSDGGSGSHKNVQYNLAA